MDHGIELNKPNFFLTLMSSSLQYFATKTIDRAAREALYSGQVVVLKNLTSAAALCDHFATSFLNEELLSSSHLDVQQRIDYCERFETSPEIHALYSEIFRQAGLVHSETHWDRLRLRVQHAGDPIDDYENSTTFGAGRFSSTLPIHRDTWGSNIMQQLNWWMPLRPLHKNCTLVLYPSFFNVPVQNSSNDWSLKELKKARKNNLPYPQLPTMKLHDVTTEELASLQSQLASDAVPVLIDPGDVLVFSGAHLHGSAVGGELGSFTRYSTEVRTFNVMDEKEENGIMGAKNIDGPKKLIPQKKWFRPL